MPTGETTHAPVPPDRSGPRASADGPAAGEPAPGAIGGSLLEGRDPGLTAAQVAERRADGRANDVPLKAGRTVGEIVRANVFTRFNAIVGVLFAIIAVIGPVQDGLFGLVIVVNTVIGIVQELRAKRTLEKLAIVGEAKPRVRRDGATQDVPTSGVVLDDVIELGSGDTIVVDGVVLEADGLEVDESLLTGEADPVHKEPGDPVLSGSFVSAGTGCQRATKVGREAYAARLAEEASRFTLVRSELRSGIDRILAIITYLVVPAAALIIWNQLRTADGQIDDALRGMVAAVVPMVPEGLVLLTSIAFALGVIRLGRRNCLVQELPAIEGLARVDVVCVDKTGTLTENGLLLESVRPVTTGNDEVPRIAGADPGLAGDGARPSAGSLVVLPSEGEAARRPGGNGAVGSLDEAGLREVLGALAAADPRPNPSLTAIAEGCPSPGWTPTGTVPFASARKWGGATFDGRGSWVLGAPDVLAPGTAAADDAERLGANGLRVLMLARTAEPPSADAPPAGVSPRALVVLEQRIRPEAEATLRYFADQGVVLKVISGDNAVSVGAVAAALSLPGAQHPRDARSLPAEREALADTMESTSVFGRVTPAQKREMVGALQARSHTVAMTGDGVNDVLALKDADIGVAMGSGSPATRAVAQIVLLDSSFATLPHVVAEGRRVIGNIERVASLFLTKTVYSVLLAVVIGLAGVPFPFLPRHLTLIGALTIGIPAFFLALAPNTERARTGFVRRVLRLAVPAGIVAGTCTVVAYLLARADGAATPGQQSTAALTALFLVAWWVLVLVARPLAWWKVVLVTASIAVYTVSLLSPLPFGRLFWGLDPFHAPTMLIAGGVAMIGMVTVTLAHTVLSRTR